MDCLFKSLREGDYDTLNVELLLNTVAPPFHGIVPSRRQVSLFDEESEKILVEK